MPGENEDLLLRIQSDVASGVAGMQSFAQGLQQLIAVNQQTLQSLQDVSGQMFNLLNVQTQTQQSTTKTTEGFSQAQAQVVTYAAALGALRDIAGKVTSAFVGQTAALAAHAEQIGNAAQQANVSGRFYQELELRLERLGLGAGAARMSLLFFNRAIDDAREGTGKLALIMQELGVDVSRNRNTAEILKDVAVALDQMNDAQKRVSFQRSMFGRAGMGATTWLHDLAKDSDELTTSWKAMSAVLNDDLTKQLQAFDNSLDSARESMKGLSNQIRAHQSEALKPFVDLFSKVTGYVAESQTSMNLLGKAVGILSIAMASALIPQVVALTYRLIALAAANALASGGLSLIFAAVGVTAAAWIAYSQNVKTAGDQTEETARKCKTSSEMMADAVKNLKPLSAHGPELEAARKADNEFIKDQKKLIDEGKEAQKQADEDVRISLEKRVRGERAALEIERDINIARLERKRDQDIEEKRGEPGFINTKSAIEKKYGAEIEGIRTAFKERLLALEQAQQDGLNRIAIDGELKRQQSLLTIERETLGQKRKLHVVDETEYFNQLKDITKREYLGQQAASDQLIKLAQATHDPQKIADAREKARAIERKYTEDVVALANQRANAEKDAANARADALGQVKQLYEQAFGTPQTQRIQQLVTAQDQLLQTLEKYPDQAARIREAYAKLIQDAKAGTIDLRDTFVTSIDDMFSGAIMGTRNMSDVFEAFRLSLVKSFAKGFADALMEKLNFDTKMNVNFLQDLPAMAKRGAGSIGQIFSNLFSLISGGSGVGPSVNVDNTAASFTGGQGFSFASALGFGGGSPLDYGMSTLGGGAMSMVPSTGAAAGSNAQVAAAGIPGGAGGFGFSSLLGPGLLGVGAGSMFSSLFGGGAVGSSLGGLAGGALAGAMLAGPLGALIGGAIGGVIGFVADLFGGGGPTQEHVNMDSIRDWVTKAGILKASGTIGGQPAWGDHSIIDRVFPGITDVGPMQPLGNTILSITNAVLGNDQGQAGMAVNAFVNNVQLLGFTLEQGKKQLLDMAKAAGVDMVKAIDSATQLLRDGTITQQAYNDAVGGAVSLFNDLPARIDATVLAESALVSVQGKLIIDQDKLKDAIDAVTKSSSLAKDALTAYFDAAFLDPKDAAEQQRQRDNEVATAQARIKYLEEARDRAKALGDTVAQAEAEMGLASERAALSASQSAAKALSPQEALMQSIKEGLKKSIIDGIIQGVVQGGMLQVALAPVMAAIKAIGVLLADPNATKAQIDAAFAQLGTSIQGVVPIMNSFMPYVNDLLGKISPFLDYIDRITGEYIPLHGMPTVEGERRNEIFAGATKITSVDSRGMRFGGARPTIPLPGGGTTTTPGLIPITYDGGHTYFYQDPVTKRLYLDPQGQTPFTPGGTSYPFYSTPSANMGAQYATTGPSNVNLTVNLGGTFVGADRTSFAALARLIANETHTVLQRNRLVGR